MPPNALIDPRTAFRSGENVVPSSFTTLSNNTRKGRQSQRLAECFGYLGIPQNDLCIWAVPHISAFRVWLAVWLWQPRVCSNHWKGHFTNDSIIGRDRIHIYLVQIVFREEYMMAIRHSLPR